MLKAGKYEAKIIDYALGESKNGTPQVVVLFGIDHSEGHSEITYYGYLSEKAKEYTIKNLLTMGLKTNDLADLAEGVPSGMLDAETPVLLVIEEETDTDELGKPRTRSKVRYINPIGGAAFRNKFSSDQARRKLASLNLKADIALARQEAGTSVARSASKPSTDDFEPDFGDTNFP